MNSADKAWITRKANAQGANKVQPTDTRNPDVDLIMVIGVGMVSDSDSRAVVTCGFRYEYKTKLAESAVTTFDRALLSIKLTSHTTTVDPSADFTGHDKVKVDLVDGLASDLESILPRMTALDNVLSTAFAESEDSSFPMSLQAIAWNLRVDFIIFEGKRSKRGMAYPIGEQVCNSVMALYGADTQSA